MKRVVIKFLIDDDYNSENWNKIVNFIDEEITINWMANSFEDELTK